MQTNPADRTKRESTFGGWMVYVAAGLMSIVGVAIAAVVGAMPTETKTDLQGLPSGVKMVAAFVGGVLLFAGGFLASAAYTSRASVRDARKVFADELGSIYRNLNRIWVQITNATEAGLQGSSDADSAFLRVVDAVSSLQGQIAEINELSGQALTTSQIVTTNKALIALRSDLENASESGSSEERAFKQEQLRVLDALTAQAGPALVTPVIVDCPYCSTANQLDLPTAIGATVRQFCASCSRPFNAHRTSSGTFSRPMPTHSPLSPPMPARVRRPWTCTDCGAHSTFLQRPGSLSSTAVCMNCYQSVQLLQPSDPGDPAQPFEVTPSQKFAAIEAQATGRRGNFPTVECEGVSLTAGIRDAPRARFCAVCEIHQRVLLVQNDTFGAWLRLNEPNVRIPYVQ